MVEGSQFDISRERLAGVAKGAVLLPFKIAGFAIERSVRAVVGVHADLESAEMTPSAALANATHIVGRKAVEASLDAPSNVTDIASKPRTRKRAPKPKPEAVRSGGPGRDRYGHDLPDPTQPRRDLRSRSERFAHLKKPGD